MNQKRRFYKGYNELQPFVTTLLFMKADSNMRRCVFEGGALPEANGKSPGAVKFVQLVPQSAVLELAMSAGRESTQLNDVDPGDPKAFVAISVVTAPLHAAFSQQWSSPTGSSYSKL